MTPWTLLVIFLPLADSGLVMGWTATYPTQRECRVAQAHAASRAGSEGLSYVVTSCVERK